MSGIDVDKIAQEAINAIADKIKNLNTLNIIVAGKTGVGKSTLINSVFKEHLADTGMGKPVTTHMRKITKKGVPLAIYDTRGFELGKEVQAEVKKEVMETINKGLATQDINKAIHCIWYCINTASNRIEPEEVEWLRELSMDNQITQVPIVVVLTQSFSKKKAQEMRQTLLNENLDIIQVIHVLAEDYEIEGLGIAKSYGLDILIKVMGEALPDELVDTLQHVQIACLEEKKRRAQAAVATAAVAAAGEGAAPIPFSDCALLVTNIIKFIPGAGTVVGGAISAGTAGVITAALGEAYIGIMELVFKGDMSIDDLGTKKGKDAMSALFKNQLKIKK